MRQALVVGAVGGVGVDAAVVVPVVPAVPAADEVVVAAPLPEPDQVRLGDLPRRAYGQRAVLGERRGDAVRPGLLFSGVVRFHGSSFQCLNLTKQKNFRNKLL